MQSFEKRRFCGKKVLDSSLALLACPNGLGTDICFSKRRLDLAAKNVCFVINKRDVCLGTEEGIGGTHRKKPLHTCLMIRLA